MTTKELKSLNILLLMHQYDTEEMHRDSFSLFLNVKHKEVASEVAHSIDWFIRNPNTNRSVY